MAIPPFGSPPPKTTIQKNGSTVGSRKTVNLIEGSGVFYTITDNSGSNRVDVTITGAGSFARSFALMGA